jgi:hypothetical protein
MFFYGCVCGVGIPAFSSFSWRILALTAKITTRATNIPTKTHRTIKIIFNILVPDVATATVVPVCTVILSGTALRLLVLQKLLGMEYISIIEQISGIMIVFMSLLSIWLSWIAEPVPATLL